MFKAKWADQIVDSDGNKRLLFRCDLDGALVTNSQESLQEHRGHQVKAPVILKWHERLMIRMGWIK